LKIGITYHEKFKQYDFGEWHPFRGDRFVNSINFFKEKGLLNLPNVTLIEPEPATRKDLLKAHDEKYIDLIFNLAKENRPYDLDTPVSQKILEAALYIVGGALEAGKQIFEGKINRAIALGCGLHHAGRNYGGGFCLFNDIAILVNYLREEFRLKRALILDYDVHFGNGTSDIFYNDPNILFISLHQDPRTLYPGTGFIEQIGEGAGKGYNINVPLPPGTGDKTYIKVLNEIFEPLAEEFKPEFIIGNGGSDSHFKDTLGSLNLTVNGFFSISKTIAKTSDKLCNGKMALLIGSGYNPNVLPQCWYALAAGAVGLEQLNVTDQETPDPEPPYVPKKVEETVSSLKKILRAYWKCFG
jgi:acetoin utilization protein AcuC